MLVVGPYATDMPMSYQHDQIVGSLESTLVGPRTRDPHTISGTGTVLVPGTTRYL